MNPDSRVAPKENETIIWRHSSGRVVAPKRISKKQILVWKWVFFIIWLIQMIFWLSRPSTLEFLKTYLGFSTLLIGVLIGFLIPKLVGFYGEKANRRRCNLALPIWMSKERLIYTTGLGGTEFEMNLTEIQTATEDFERGSPALILQSASRTVKLMTSEMRQLREKLFLLRPELKGAS